ASPRAPPWLMPIRAVLHDKPTGSVADHSAAASLSGGKIKVLCDDLATRLSKRLAESDRLVDGRFLRISVLAGLTQPAAVSELSSSWSQQTRVTSTLLVCAVVLAMILALFALFIVQRFSFVETKTTRNDLVDWSVGQQATTRELCRQRMSEKERPEVRRKPVSTRLARGCSGEERQSRGSRTGPQAPGATIRLTTDMDITTGHLILNYMEN
uniref:Cadherin_2 domain-containing protein n=1 Tax=Macrostomum lignano TaxID=282301 RepID=A0A1I8FSN5_9PLAT